ncbi:hypothetical protein SAMN05660745_02423 [Corynebacterium glucuronolyticum]|nr:VRR-NUC domain protein [Corynebacterium glucuronolyticum DSM 44120]SMB81470.1 hypothetical protein SAMN05660745_02423 [Corynebacterium glucuronolyticum]
MDKVVPSVKRGKRWDKEKEWKTGLSPSCPKGCPTIKTAITSMFSLFIFFWDKRDKKILGNDIDSENRYIYTPKHLIQRTIWIRLDFVPERPKMDEKSIEQNLRKQVQRIGARAVKLTSPGTAGMPDRLLLLPGGKVIFVELKASRGHLRPIQKRRHEQLRALGFTVRTINSQRQIDELINEIQTSRLPGLRH